MVGRKDFAQADAGLRSSNNNLDRAAPICYRSSLQWTYKPQMNADERRYRKAVLASCQEAVPCRWRGYAEEGREG